MMFIETHRRPPGRARDYIKISSANAGLNVRIHRLSSVTPWLALRICRSGVRDAVERDRQAAD